MDTTPAVLTDPIPKSDRVIAVVLLVALGLVSPIVSFYALLFSMVSDGCTGDRPCDANQIGQGISIAAVSPWLALLGGVIVVVQRVRQQRRVWWVPLVAAVLGAVLFVAGAIMAASAVG